MRRGLLKAAGVTGALLVTSAILPAQAQAQTTYGRWYQTNDCQGRKPAPEWLPERLRGPALPGGAQECRWERVVRRCPRIFRSIRDCTERKERTGYTSTRPDD